MSFSRITVNKQIPGIVFLIKFGKDKKSG